MMAVSNTRVVATTVPSAEGANPAVAADAVLPRRLDGVTAVAPVPATVVVLINSAYTGTEGVPSRDTPQETTVRSPDAVSCRWVLSAVPVATRAIAAVVGTA